ncbi:hypothetical protein R3P38DRAFT_1947843 [Favolaschia claudopus]|uniref:Uncharacterized protein n=1 Tax=Favolaschia claudopus TaxID=2862362 RepID=A0AAW0A0R4_9AGAR
MPKAAAQDINGGWLFRTGKAVPCTHTPQTLRLPICLSTERWWSLLAPTVQSAPPPPSTWPIKAQKSSSTTPTSTTPPPPVRSSRSSRPPVVPPSPSRLTYPPSRGGKHLVDEAVKAFGGIDVLVLYHAVMRMNVLKDVEEEFFDAHFAENVKGPLFLAKAAAPLLPSRACFFEFVRVSGWGLMA